MRRFNLNRALERTEQGQSRWRRTHYVQRQLYYGWLVLVGLRVFGYGLAIESLKGILIGAGCTVAFVALLRLVWR